MTSESRVCFVNIHNVALVVITVVTIRYPHDTIRIAILGENRKMNQLITIGSLYCILCSFDLSRQHLAFALLLFNSMSFHIVHYSLK